LLAPSQATGRGKEKQSGGEKKKNTSYFPSSHLLHSGGGGNQEKREEGGRGVASFDIRLPTTSTSTLGFRQKRGGKRKARRKRGERGKRRGDRHLCSIPIIDIELH